MRLVKNQLELFSFVSSLHPLATTALNFQHPHKHSHCSSFYSFEPVKLENSKSDLCNNTIKPYSYRWLCWFPHTSNASFDWA